MTWIALSIYSETGYRSFYFTEEVSLCATVSKRAKKKLAYSGRSLEMKQVKKQYSTFFELLLLSVGTILLMGFVVA